MGASAAAAAPTGHYGLTPLYFAYGSNLDDDDWRRFCVRHGFEASVLTPFGPASLADEVLVFDYRSVRRGCGALNIRAQSGGLVDGYLFEVGEDGWAALDFKEGHPRRYRRETVTVQDPSGTPLAAQTYRVVPAMRRGFDAPSADYLAVCRAGRLRFGLSLAQLEAAVILDGAKRISGIGEPRRRSIEHSGSGFGRAAPE